MWCEKHSELFENNGVPPDKILNQVVKILAATWKVRTGLNMKTDDASVKMVMSQIGKGKPFCCFLGDEKLQRILISVSTDVEKKKAGM